MLTRRYLLAGATFAAAASSTGGLWAQGTYPDHPIRIIVGYAAGGGGDLASLRVVGISASHHQDRE